MKDYVESEEWRFFLCNFSLFINILFREDQRVNSEAKFFSFLHSPLSNLHSYYCTTFFTNCVP